MDYPPIWTPAPGVTLYNADCLEVLPTLAGLDAVITDPPYGIQYDASHTKYLGGTDRDGQADWDMAPYDPAPILALDLPSVIWGAQCFASRMPDRPAWLIWIKTQRDAVQIRQAEAELAWCNAIQRSQVIRHLWIGAFRDSESGQQNIHPTQKPVRVMAWCMDAARVATGALVVDPYMGSASTILACIRTGRRAIGIERDPGHYQAACARVAAELQQPFLLAPIQAALV